MFSVWSFVIFVVSLKRWSFQRWQESFSSMGSLIFLSQYRKRKRRKRSAASQQILLFISICREWHFPMGKGDLWKRKKDTGIYVVDFGKDENLILDSGTWIPIPPFWVISSYEFFLSLEIAFSWKSWWTWLSYARARREKGLEF